MLFIAGQGAAQLGGRPAEGLGNGYLDNMPTRPGGFTLYCSVASELDLAGLSWVCDLPALKDSVLHLSVSWVADFDLSTKDNNRIITTGAFDENIDRLAQWCAAQPRPILMRLGYEFDRGFPIPDFHYDPVYFAHGFRRMVDRLRAAGADNVSTVLASTNFPSLSPALTTEAFNRFYPGDDYADWLGCSMWTPTDVDKIILSEARKRDKPVLLAETTPVKYNITKSAYYPYYLGKSEKVTAQAIWDGWHQPMIDFIQANSDVIGAWHYIAADWSAEPVWKWVPLFVNCDARPWGTPQFLEIWNNRMNSAPFLQTSASLFRDLGYS
ncbi:MAG: hypothetical protein ABSB74_09140 [Tepidisphaeraceae bacterium]